VGRRGAATPGEFKKGGVFFFRFPPGSGAFACLGFFAPVGLGGAQRGGGKPGENRGGGGAGGGGGTPNAAGRAFFPHKGGGGIRRGGRGATGPFPWGRGGRQKKTKKNPKKKNKQGGGQPGGGTTPPWLGQLKPPQPIGWGTQKPRLRWGGGPRWGVFAPHRGRWPGLAPGCPWVGNWRLGGDTKPKGLWGGGRGGAGETNEILGGAGGFRERGFFFGVGWERGKKNASLGGPPGGTGKKER